MGIFGSTWPGSWNSGPARGHPTSATEYCTDMVGHAVVQLLRFSAASSGFWGGLAILINQDNICSYGSTDHCLGLVEGDSGGSFHKSGSHACQTCKLYFSIFGAALIVLNIIAYTMAA